MVWGGVTYLPETAFEIAKFIRHIDKLPANVQSALADLLGTLKNVTIGPFAEVGEQLRAHNYFEAGKRLQKALVDTGLLVVGGVGLVKNLPNILAKAGKLARVAKAGRLGTARVISKSIKNTAKTAPAVAASQVGDTPKTPPSQVSAPPVINTPPLEPVAAKPAQKLDSSLTPKPAEF